MLNLPSKIPKNKVILSVIISAVIVLLIVLRNEIFSLGAEDEKNLHEHFEIRQQYLKHQYDDNQTAFVFGATGMYSTSELFKCMSAVESLSTVGGWGGHVYVLVDQSECINKDMIKKLPNKNIHIIHVNKERRRRLRDADDNSPAYGNMSSARHGHHKHGHRHLLTDQPFQRAMAVKMHALEYLPEHIQYAVWYDCDVLFVKPQCVRTMLEHKPALSYEKPFFLRQNNHVGTFVVHKEYSQKALQVWHDKLLEVNSPSALGNQEAVPDYEVFSRLFGRFSGDSGAQFGILHPTWHDIMPPMLPNNGSLYWNTTECVIHFSNGRCNHLGAKEIDHVVKELHLQSYEGQTWCPSVLRRKFKSYGFQWPFCWNPPSYFWNGS